MTHGGLRKDTSPSLHPAHPGLSDTQFLPTDGLTASSSLSGQALGCSSVLSEG